MSDGGYVIPPDFVVPIEAEFRDEPFWLTVIPRAPLPPLTRRQRLRAIPRRIRYRLGDRLIDVGVRLTGYDPRGDE